MRIEAANNGDFVAVVVYHLRTDVDVGSDWPTVLIQATIRGIRNHIQLLKDDDNTSDNHRKPKNPKPTTYQRFILTQQHIRH